MKKNVLIFGFGESGRSAFLILNKKNKNKFFIFDEDEKCLEYANDNYGKLKNVYILKNLNKNIISFMDMLVLSPGVSIYNPYVTYAKRLKKEIIGEMELGFLNTKKKIIAISGTNGKTTCTRLLTEILNNANKRAVSAGNIGYPLSRAIVEHKRAKIFVVETSSFQLETINKFKPDVACILNITPDHINRHKSYQNYIKCKKNIFKNMGRKDVLVLNSNLSKLCETKKSKFCYAYFNIDKANKCVFEKDDEIIYKSGNKKQVVCKKQDISLIGSHNLENVMACILIAKLYNIKNKYILEALKNFKLSPHRIELVYKIDGTSFFDDSKATNIDSTKRAMESFEDSTLLLLGGSEKGYSFGELFKNFPNHIDEVVCFGEVGKKIFDASQGFHIQSRCFETLKEATNYACSVAGEYKNILLSPANASFDEFKSYKDRGEKFLEYIKEYYEKDKN